MGLNDNNEALSQISPELLKQHAVLLSRGTNLLGETIYAYIRFPMTNFYKLRAAIQKGENFKPIDYGQVLATGRGEPSVALKEEMRLKYGLVDVPKSDQTQKNVSEIKERAHEFYDIIPKEGLSLELSKEIKRLGHIINNI